MKKEGVFVIIIITVAIGLVWYLSQLDSTKLKKYDWNQTYQEGYKNPYDFGLFKDLIKKGSKNFKVAKTELKESLKSISKDSNASYVFIGSICYYTKDEVDALLKFANQGHQVLIISESMPDTLLTSFWYQSYPCKISFFFDKTVNLKSENYLSTNRDYSFSYLYANDTSINRWSYIDDGNISPFYVEDDIDASPYLRLSTINDRLNYVRFRVGYGWISINTTPLLFTNHILKTNEGFNYASEVFSEFKRETILYDTYSRIYKDDSESVYRKDQSPLSYILSQKSLKWAWYLFLLTVLLFFLFKIKRKQRIIPVIEQKNNTTVDFVETLSNLYLGRANHAKMAETKMNLFLFFIKNKLKVSSQSNQDKFIQLISQKSGVNKELVDNIFIYYRTLNIENDAVGADELIELNNRISDFYNNFYKINHK